MSYNGYDYPTVAIGNNIWFAENLRTTNYTNGDAIPYKSNASQWTGSSAGAQCHYDGNAAYLINHGKIYNGYAVLDERGLCPAGWNVPTDSEASYPLNGTYAHKTSPSDNPSWDGTNTSGFGMTPGGYRDAAGTFKEGNKIGTYVRCKKTTTVQAYARPAENITSTSADLMARVAQWPAGAQVEEAWFTWSTSSLFDPEVAPENVDCVEYTGEILDSTPDLDVVKLSLTDLQPNTTYYYRIHTVNVAGERASSHSEFTTTE